MSTETDLFGEAIVGNMDIPRPISDQRRKSTKPNGYAALPGTGPKGETCKTCEHYSGYRRSKIYRKCGLMQAKWTGGPGTDILARSPACAYWEKEKP